MLVISIIQFRKRPKFILCILTHGAKSVKSHGYPTKLVIRFAFLKLLATPPVKALVILVLWLICNIKLCTDCVRSHKEIVIYYYFILFFTERIVSFFHLLYLLAPT